MSGIAKAKGLIARLLALLLLIGALATDCSSAPVTVTPTAPANAIAPTETHRPEANATSSPAAAATSANTPSPTPAVPTGPAGNPFGQVTLTQSPDKRWTAVLDTRVGSLELQRADGKTFTVFAPGSTADSVTWSPDSQRLLVVKANYYPSPAHTGYVFLGPIEIWQVRPEQSETPTRLFQSSTDPKTNPGGADTIDFGHWSPNSRSVLFWLGSTSGSFQADGATLFAVDVEDGTSTLLAEHALLNPRYQSWSPDGSALAFTAGGYRSAQIRKWLSLYDAKSGTVRTVVDQGDAVPGIVAWSPRGGLIAYAAVPASETGDEWADYHAFDNPAILKRRVYLLDPKTDKRWRLNNVDAFQDAPAWSADGSVLYYVQREGDDMVLIAADPSTGMGQVIDGSRRPAPERVGYYGQSEWDDVLAFRPDVAPAQVPPLTQTYADSMEDYSIQYPSGWAVGMGWRHLIYSCGQCVVVSPSTETDALDDGPFSGKLFLSIESLGPASSALAESDMEKLLANLLTSPGPGQILNRDGRLKAFDRNAVTVGGKPALRLETMGDAGEVNHMLVVDDGRATVLRGKGDGRVFDAIAATLKFALPSTPVPSSALPPTSEWPIYRHPMGVEVRYPPGWRVDSTAVFVHFCDGPAAGRCVGIVNHSGLKQASDFTAEVGLQAAMTKPLTLDGQPAVFVQVRDPASFEGIASVVAVVTPAGRGLTIDNRADATLFEQLLSTIRFFRSDWP